MTATGYLHVGLVVAGLLAGLFLYRIAAHRFAEWLIKQPWFGWPSGERARLGSASGEGRDDSPLCAQ